MLFPSAQNGAFSIFCQRVLSDKDLKNGKEPCDKSGKENSRQRKQEVQRAVRLEKDLPCSRTKAVAVGGAE